MTAGPQRLPAFVGAVLVASSISKFANAHARSLPLAAMLLACAAASSSHAARTRPLLFRNVRVFDGATITQGDVLVAKGLIRAVGPKLAAKGATVVDGTGKTLLPGFIDAHTHAYEDKALPQALVFGVTTELEMFGDPKRNVELRRKEMRAEATGAADLRSSGILATAPRGHGTEYGVPIPTLGKPEEAVTFVEERLAEGSDYLKIVLDDGTWFRRGIPTLDAATVAALVRAAHTRNKLAVVHIGSQAGARTALEARADGLAHVFIDRAPDADFAALVAEHHAFVIPTLTVLSAMCDDADRTSLGSDPAVASLLDERDQVQLAKSFPKKLPAAHCGYALATVKQLAAAHVPILAGSDALNPGVVHGASLHREIELLVEAGLSPIEALAAGTSTPAARFGLPDRGRIAPGLRADLVLVDGDPTADIRTTRAIAGVWKRGVAVDRDAWRRARDQERAAIVEERALPPPPGSDAACVADFEDGKVAARWGAGMAPSTDALRGGSSVVDLEVVSGGAGGTKSALAVSGEIKGDTGFGWAGVLFSPGAMPMTPANLSAKKTLRFWVKGDGQRHRVMLFARHLGVHPAMRWFIAPAAWTEVTMPLADFAGVDGRDVTAILWTGGPEAGEFAFTLDEVELR